MGKVLSFCMQKGGVGKTTSCLNISAGLARLKKKVLAVDLDAQGHLSLGLLGGPGPEGQTSLEVLKGEVAAKEAIFSAGDVDIIPASIDLAGGEPWLLHQEEKERAFFLSSALDPLKKKYDFITIDTGPALGLLTYNGLAAADMVLIPVEMEYYALHGLAELSKTIEEVKEFFNPGLEKRIFATKLNRRRKLTDQVQEEIKSYFKGEFLKTGIPDNVSIIEAPANQKDIFSYKKNSAGAKAYMKLCKEILKVTGGKQGGRVKKK